MVVQRLGPCLYPVSCPSAEHLYMLTPEVLSGVISCEEVDQNKHVTVMSGGGQREAKLGVEARECQRGWSGEA